MIFDIFKQMVGGKMAKKNRCRNYPECRNYEFKFGFCRECYMIFLQEKILEAMVFGVPDKNKPIDNSSSVDENITPTFIPEIDIPTTSGNIKMSEDEREADNIDMISGKLESLGR
ncbi:MAG: hypothetical protein QXD03_03755 [Candidatus Anstonellales archaeon]